MVEATHLPFKLHNNFIIVCAINAVVLGPQNIRLYTLNVLELLSSYNIQIIHLSFHDESILIITQFWILGVFCILNFIYTFFALESFGGNCSLDSNGSKIHVPNAVKQT